MSTKETRFELNQKNIKRAMSNAFWSLKQIFKLAPKESLLLILTNVGSILLSTLDTYLGTRVLDEVVKAMVEKRAFSYFITFENRLTQLLLITAVITFLITLVSKFNRYLEAKFSEVHLQTQNRELYAKIISLSVAQHEDKEFSKGIKKANESLWRMKTFFNEAIDFINTFTDLIISGVLVYAVSPILLITVLLLGMPKAIIGFSTTLKRWKLYDDIYEKYKKRGWIAEDILYSKAVSENIITGAKDFLLTQLKNLSEFISRKNLAQRKEQFKTETYIEVLSFVQEILSSIFVLAKTLTGSFTVGDFSFYWNRGTMFTNRFRRLLEILILMFDDMTAVEEVRVLMESTPSIISGNKSLQSGMNPPSIEFRDVSFKYPESENLVLKNINMVINPGDEIAIVGENGVGKTTFLKLLLRFYDVTEGEILVDGINIKDISLTQYYKRIGAVFQDYNIYKYLNIKENITIGAPNSVIDLEKLNEVARFSEADMFINKLPHKFNQVVDTRFEKGTNLSTGQNQKIALARMFYRDAPILILDEPTSSIDAVAESRIFNKIYDFTSNKTVIIISHRFSTVRKAEKVYVFSDGKIAESGSHSELMRLNGVYADAFNKQAEGYTKED